MKGCIVEEALYAQEMRGMVEPYLEKCRSVVWLEREPGRRIYCELYPAGGIEASGASVRHPAQGDERASAVQRPVQGDEGASAAQPVQGDAAAGTVLISHGFTESAEKYREVIWYFHQEGFHVLIPEHCGHGRSYRLTEDPSLVHMLDWEAYVEDLLFAAHRAKEEWPGLPLYVFGHSMGGGIAAAAAAKEPGLFAKAVLSSPMIRPLTAGVPYPLAKAVTAAACACGRAESYVIGQRAYGGREKFEDSAATSEPRFTYYQDKRVAQPMFQQSAASFGWVRAAAGLSGFLLKQAWKQIAIPVLLCQAGRDVFVSNEAQDRFIQKLGSRINEDAVMLRVPGAKHEIYNSDDATVRMYWERIFTFLTGKAD